MSGPARGTGQRPRSPARVAGSHRRILCPALRQRRAVDGTICISGSWGTHAEHKRLLAQLRKAARRLELRDGFAMGTLWRLSAKVSQRTSARWTANTVRGSTNVAFGKGRRLSASSHSRIPLNFFALPADNKIFRQSPAGGNAVDHLAWNDKYSVGLKVLDDQHLELFANLNRLHQAMTSGLDPSVTGPPSLSLIEATRRHFTSEEEILAETRISRTGVSPRAAPGVDSARAVVLHPLPVRTEPVKSASSQLFARLVRPPSSNQ